MIFYVDPFTEVRNIPTIGKKHVAVRLGSNYMYIYTASGEAALHLSHSFPEDGMGLYVRFSLYIRAQPVVFPEISI